MQTYLICLSTAQDTMVLLFCTFNEDKKLDGFRSKKKERAKMLWS